MQQNSKEMQGIIDGGGGQIGMQELQNGHQIDHSSAVGHDDFLDQMLSNLQSSWPDFAAGDPAAFDETLLASRLRQHQISGGAPPPGKSSMLMQLNQQQLLMQGMARSGGDSGLMPLPLSLGNGGAPPRDDAGSEGLFNGFSGSLQRAANQPHFPHAQQGAAIPQQNFAAAPSPAASQAPGTGQAAAPPRQRVRARRGQATDPHSIAERLRRERIAERMKALQELVPNANKTDKASMLDEIIDYVKFLQLQVKVLSMSRLGGAAAVAPLVADISSEGQGGSSLGRSGGGGASDSMSMAEHQVAELMEKDMGSAMQYLQGKGLCLMPISLASAISSATCHPRAAPSAIATHLNPGLIHPPANNAGGDNPSSPSMSVLTVQSAMANGAAAADASSSAKDATSVSKP